jgi:hypothetical protein
MALCAFVLGTGYELQTGDERTRAEELYDLHRDKVWEDIKSGTESFDKYMLTFSSGALALSLAFIKDVVPLGKAVWSLRSLGLNCVRALHPRYAGMVHSATRLAAAIGWRRTRRSTRGAPARESGEYSGMAKVENVAYTRSLRVFFGVKPRPGLRNPGFG